MSGYLDQFTESEKEVMRQKLKKSLDRLVPRCGHPCECQKQDDDENWFCAWCDEVEQLRRTNEQLTNQLTKQAIVVTGGESTINCRELGYLSVHDGATVKIQTAEPMLVYGLDNVSSKDNASPTNEINT